MLRESRKYVETLKFIPKMRRAFPAGVLALFALANCSSGSGGGDSGAIAEEVQSLWVQTKNPGSGVDQPAQMVIVGEFLYIVGVETVATNDTRWRVEKRNKTDGSLVPSFGSEGVFASQPSPGMDSARAVVADATSLYVGGHDEAEGDRRWRIEKLDQITGQRDTRFGANGVVTVNPSGGYDSLTSLATDGVYLYAVGWESHPTENHEQLRIEKRRVSTGNLVNDFDGDGVVLSNPSAFHDAAWTIAIDSDFLYVGGYKSFSDSGRNGYIEKRSLTDGTLSYAVVSSSYTYGEIMALAVDSSYLYAAGFDNDTTNGKPQWRIEKRTLANGNLVAAFGLNGVVQVDASAEWDLPSVSGMAIDATQGALYIAGRENLVSADPSSNSRWRIEKRSTLDGSLLPSFGFGGVLTRELGSGNDAADDIVVDAAFAYVAGRDTSPGPEDTQWRVECLLK